MLPICPPRAVSRSPFLPDSRTHNSIRQPTDGDPMSTETTTFSGIVPPIVTPLTLEGEVDTTSLERLLSLQIEAGVDGLFVLGSSGEVGYLTDAQRAQVVQTAIGHVGGQVPVLVGVNDMTTNRVSAVAEQAREAGADAIVATAPFYAITDAAETATHFRSIHAAVDLPLFAYDVPVRVHSKLSPAMLVELGREGRSEEHTSELQSLMRISYAVFCLK